MPSISLTNLCGASFLITYDNRLKKWINEAKAKIYPYFGCQLTSIIRLLLTYGVDLLIVPAI
jgi:hypothetical protein